MGALRALFANSPVVVFVWFYFDAFHFVLYFQECTKGGLGSRWAWKIKISPPNKNFPPWSYPDAAAAGAAAAASAPASAAANVATTARAVVKTRAAAEAGAEAAAAAPAAAASG